MASQAQEKLELGSLADEDATVRRSSRERTQTERGREHQKQCKEHMFKSAISRWRRQVNSARSTIDDAKDIAMLRQQRHWIQTEMDGVKSAFDELDELLESTDKHQIHELFEEVDRDHFKLMSDISAAIRIVESEREDAHSTSTRRSRSCLSQKSNVSRVSIKAEIAAKAAEAEAELKYIDAEAVKRAELERLQALKKLAVAKAKLDAINQVEEDANSLLDESEELEEPIMQKFLSSLPGNFDPQKSKSKLNPRAAEFQSGYVKVQEVNQQPQVFGTDALAQALADTMQRNRLPVPVPSTFSGNPLEYMDFERSFKTLIESRGIPPAEKLYYLKQYVTGPAREAVEGFFFGDTEEAYQGAWATLRDRYGHPFKIQQSFRKKLDNWPRVNPKDVTSLQKFADFLKSCCDAVPYVDGLQVLNDCMENQKMLSKLPEWMVSRWNRVATESLDVAGTFPSFAKFVTFVVKEARVANNPVSSTYAVRSQEGNEKRDTRIHGHEKREVTRGKGTVLVTKAKVNMDNNREYIPKPCSLCSKADHQLEKCPQFLSKPLEGRKMFVQESRLCYGCLKKGHISRDCRRRLKCEECNRRHPSALHEDRPYTVGDRAQSSAPKEAEGSREASAVSCKVHLGERSSSSMIVPVWISSEQAPSMEILTYALLDTQSDSSFILEDVAKALMVKQQPVRLKLATMTSSSTVTCSVVTNLLVRGMTQTTPVKLQRSYTRDFIPVDRDHIPSRKTAEAWPHLQDMASEIPVLQDCEVGLLIGYNCPQALAPRQTITGKNEEPYAIRTDLGWSIVGSTGRLANQQLVGQCHRVVTQEVPSPTPKEVLKALEADFAERHCGDKVCSQEDLEFVKQLEASIKQCDDGHMEMPLPFRARPELPNNRKLAMIRLRHLKRKLDRDERYKEHYMTFMEEVINNGYAERAPEDAPAGNINYIPHHGVYHPKKKDKLRVVFDCAAKFAHTSLNEHLLKGPDLTNGLIGVLCRFRKHEVALLCDIEKMFYQFRVCEDDRDFLRFLWWENGDTSQDPVEYRMTVHLFGAASSPGCANFGLKRIAKQHRETFPLAARFVTRNFYVDDGVTSAPSTEEAIQLAEDTRALCKKGGLRLHKFISNDRAVVESVPRSERAKEVMNLNLDFDDLPVERALGVTWNPTTDVLCFEITLKEQPMTRRGILSTVASLYDPLGFVAPVVLIGKRILQEMCRSGMGWDDPIHQDLKPRWEQWLDQLWQLEQLQIPRCYHPAGFGKAVEVELHHFSDASTSGYGQCSYLRLVNQEGDVHCCLVFAKSRVAPTKVVTIPRLELTAAVVSAKVSSMLREELEYEDMQEFFWTDSKVVLGYINNEARRFHTFVANRVELIRERTTPDQWKYVSTDENPADHASRGLSPAELPATRWFSGPEFLWERKLKFEDVSPELCTEDPEVRAVVLAGTAVPNPRSLLERLSKFSSWTRMVIGLTWLRRRIKRKTHQESCIQERKDTETFILKTVQREAFPEELKSVAKDKTVPTSSTIHDLNPFLDAVGILRVGGRIGKSKLPDDVKYPVILPRSSHVTQVIVRHFHQKIQHQGRGQTLNEVRSNGYWLVNGSRAVAEVVRACVKCRRLRRPEEEQKMANLPEERVEPSAPFTYVGMDCFGPFKIKKGRSEIKRYGLLFTCFCSRGVHIEMLDDMSTDAFINGLRCFIAIRGAVRLIRCDQGSNFVGASNELKAAMKEMDANKIKSHLANCQCDFVFNAPHASHVGGVWERQIRTIRNVLRATIDLCSERLDDASLRTLLYEAMAIVNSRPLTPANLSDPSVEPPLTPNHLLTMKSTLPPPPPGCFVKEDIYARKRWRRIQYLLEQFWSRWRKEYILNLQQREKWRIPRRNLQVGDLVLLKEAEVSRMEWPLGVIKSTTVDDDGLVRKVRVQVGSRDLDKRGRPARQLSELERPIQKLILLKECD